MSARGNIQVLEEWDNKDNKSKSVHTQNPLAEIPDKIIPAPMEVNPQDEAQPDEAPAPEHQSPMELLCRLARHDKETNSDVSSIDPLALTNNPETWGSIAQALNAMANDTPNNYREAIQSGEGEEWHQAMMEELEKMEKYKVWKVVDRAPGQRVLKARWVYTRKIDGTTGKPAAYKARWVAKGFSQKAGIDYNEVDIKAAFLNGDLEETIYLEAPEGSNIPANKILLLNKSLYGLRQSPRCFNKALDQWLKSQGLKPTRADPCFYVRCCEGELLMLSVHVDDQLIACNSRKTLDEFKQKLNSKFECSDSGPAGYFLATVTRPDLAHAASVLSRFFSKWNESHWLAAKHCLRYIRGTSDLSLVFDAHSSKRVALGYVDADWGGDLDTRRSTTGYVFKVYGGVVAWKSKRQPTVALSTTEAEYMASADAAKQAIWLRVLLEDIGLGLGDQQFQLVNDNAGAITLSKNPVNHEKSKHIDMRHHFIQEKIEDKTVSLAHVPSVENIADLLTKSLPAEAFVKLCQLLGMKRLDQGGVLE
ncbi:hypothetical protein D1P53_002499 [Cryptococcus gattii VGV]|nr:hypothetical protein D1P53_002499 [Cryptococcus gattii VGV]